MAPRSFLPTPIPRYLYATFVIAQFLFLWGAVAVLIGTSALIPRIIAAVMAVSSILIMILLGAIHHLDAAPKDHQ